MFGNGFVRLGACIVRGLRQCEQAGLLGGVVDELSQMSRVDTAADDLEDLFLTDERFAAVTGQKDSDGLRRPFLGFAERLGPAHAR